MQLSLPRDASYVPVTRSVATSLLQTMNVPEEAAGDVQVVLSEACANVVRHAAGVDYRVSLSVGPEGCEVEVLDAGPGADDLDLDLDLTRPVDLDVDADAETGRGLILIRALVDDFQFAREREGTRLRLIKRWSRVEPPQLP